MKVCHRNVKFILSSCVKKTKSIHSKYYIQLSQERSVPSIFMQIKKILSYFRVKWNCLFVFASKIFLDWVTDIGDDFLSSKYESTKMCIFTLRILY